MNEQPPKNICEICGGPHVTAAHASVAPMTRNELVEFPKNRIREILWGNIDIEALNDPGDAVRRKSLIDEFKDVILARFPRPKESKLAKMSRSDFYTKLIDFYRDDKTALKTINQEKKLSVGRDSNMANALFVDSKKLPEVDFFGEMEKQASSLYEISSYLAGHPLLSIEEIEQNLKGKKILVLGDSAGDGSDALIAFGAEAYGIEIDKFRVLVAHSGIISQTGAFQTQVIEGDINDLVDQNSELYKLLKEKGPFDVVFSKFNVLGHYIFGAHGGLVNETAIAQHTSGEYLLTESLMQLLNGQGFQLHDTAGFFGPYTDPKIVERRKFTCIPKSTFDKNKNLWHSKQYS